MIEWVDHIGHLLVAIVIMVLPSKRIMEKRTNGEKERGKRIEEKNY